MLVTEFIFGASLRQGAAIIGIQCIVIGPMLYLITDYFEPDIDTVSVLATGFFVITGLIGIITSITRSKIMCFIYSFGLLVCAAWISLLGLNFADLLETRFLEGGEGLGEVLFTQTRVPRFQGLRRNSVYEPRVRSLTKPTSSVQLDESDIKKISNRVVGKIVEHFEKDHDKLFFIPQLPTHKHLNKHSIWYNSPHRVKVSNEKSPLVFSEFDDHDSEISEDILTFDNKNDNSKNNNLLKDHGFSSDLISKVIPKRISMDSSSISNLLPLLHDDYDTCEDDEDDNCEELLIEITSSPTNNNSVSPTSTQNQISIHEVNASPFKIEPKKSDEVDAEDVNINLKRSIETREGDERTDLTPITHMSFVELHTTGLKNTKKKNEDDDSDDDDDHDDDDDEGKKKKHKSKSKSKSKNKNKSKKKSKTKSKKKDDEDPDEIHIEEEKEEKEEFGDDFFKDVMKDEPKEELKELQIPEVKESNETVANAEDPDLMSTQVYVKDLPPEINFVSEETEFEIVATSKIIKHSAKMPTSIVLFSGAAFYGYFIVCMVSWGLSGMKDMQELTAQADNWGALSDHTESDE